MMEGHLEMEMQEEKENMTYPAKLQPMLVAAVVELEGKEDIIEMEDPLEALMAPTMVETQELQAQQTA